MAMATATVTVTVMATIVGPGMDAHPGTRFRVETVHPTDLEGEAAAKLLAKDSAADCGQHREAAGG